MTTQYPTPPPRPWWINQYRKWKEHIHLLNMNMSANIYGTKNISQTDLTEQTLRLCMRNGLVNYVCEIWTNVTQGKGKKKNRMKDYICLKRYKIHTCAFTGSKHTWPAHSSFKTKFKCKLGHDAVLKLTLSKSFLQICL